MIFYYACLAFSVVAGAAGQILLKIGALNQVRNAFPSVSLSYFFVSYAAHLVLGESFTSANVFALGLISVGIFILASS